MSSRNPTQLAAVAIVFQKYNFIINLLVPKDFRQANLFPLEIIFISEKTGNLLKGDLFNRTIHLDRDFIPLFQPH